MYLHVSDQYVLLWQISQLNCSKMSSVSQIMHWLLILWFLWGFSSYGCLVQFWHNSHQVVCAMAHCPKSKYAYHYVCQYCPVWVQNLCCVSTLCVIRAQLSRYVVTRTHSVYFQRLPICCPQSLLFCCVLLDITTICATWAVNIVFILKLVLELRFNGC